MHRTTALLAAAALLAACQKPPETPEQTNARMMAEADSVRPVLEGLDASYARWYSAGQTDSLVAIHMTEAVEMPPNAPAASGTAAIRQMFEAAFQMAPHGGTLALHSQNLSVNGPLAVDRGRWTFHPAAGAPIPADSGKYLTHWHNTGGSWKIAEVIWNSDTPLPTPAAPPAHHR